MCLRVYLNIYVSPHKHLCVCLSIFTFLYRHFTFMYRHFANCSCRIAHCRNLSLAPISRSLKFPLTFSLGFSPSLCVFLYSCFSGSPLTLSVSPPTSLRSVSRSLARQSASIFVRLVCFGYILLSFSPLAPLSFVLNVSASRSGSIFEKVPLFCKREQQSLCRENLPAVANPIGNACKVANPTFCVSVCQTFCHGVGFSLCFKGLIHSCDVTSH